MATKGKHVLDDFAIPDPQLVIQYYVEHDTDPHAGDVLRAAFLHLTAARPVIFRPSAQHCEALEQVTPNFTIAQYTQPYPVCIVEFPRDYTANRLIPLSPEDCPLFAIVVKSLKDGYHFLAVAVFGTMDKLSVRSWAGKEMALDVNADLERVTCAALNFLMLVDDGEVTEASIPAKKVKRKRRRIEKHRPAIPVFTLQDQSIRLFSTHEPDPDYVPPDKPHGTPKRPHWRKGHWRFYEGGKRVRIDPVLVNKHKLGNAS
jgi:hypothetical protein